LHASAFLPLGFAFGQGNFCCVFLTFALPTELRRNMAAVALYHFRTFYLLASLSGKEIFVCFPYIRPTD